MTSAHDHRADDLGDIGDEAAKLLATVQEWARRTFGEGENAHLATGGPACEWCPLCQLVSVLRGARPEATEKIVAAGSAVLTALRAVLDHPAPTAQPQPRVQRIDLGDA
jgi:hypothetical protein